MIFKASDYKSRKELDQAMREVESRGTIVKEGGSKEEVLNTVHTIEGTEEELKELSLSEKISVHGVRVVLKESKKNE